MSRLPPLAGDGRGRAVALVAALALGQAAAAAVAAFATRDAFAALRETDPAAPVPALAALAASGFALGGLRVAERGVAERLGHAYAGELRLLIFRHLGRLSARRLARQRVGSLSLRFVGDLSAVRGWASLGVARLVAAAIVLPSALGVLFVLDHRLGAAAVGPLVLGLVAMALIAPRLGRAHRRLRARRAKVAADMSERAAFAPELRLLGRSERERAHLRRRTAALIPEAVARARGAALLRAVPDAASSLAAAALFVAAARYGAPAPEAAGALAAVALAVRPMRDLAGVWDRRRAWTASRHAIERLLAIPRLAVEPGARAEALPDAPPALRFEGVDIGPLRDLWFEAAPGARIALHGPNGAGKSTLIALAAGLESPDAGRVLVGGRDARALSADERRRLVAMVGARTPILSGSLRRALSMGASPRPDDETILAEARAAGLEDLLSRLGGLDGRVSEGGRNLSTGEARRVLTVRAGLGRPRLLLLDEPEAGLDAEALTHLERVLTRIEATVLMATHSPRLRAIMDETWTLPKAGAVASAALPQGARGR